MKRRASSEASSEAEGGLDQSARQGVLPDLIDVERRVREAIGDAEAKAARAIAAAEAEASSRSVAHDAALDAALHDLEQSFERDRLTALAEIERRSDETAGRYRNVSEARVREISERVARRIAEGDLETDESEP